MTNVRPSLSHETIPQSCTTAIQMDSDCDNEKKGGKGSSSNVPKSHWNGLRQPVKNERKIMWCDFPRNVHFSQPAFSQISTKPTCVKKITDFFTLFQWRCSTLNSNFFFFFPWRIKILPWSSEFRTTESLPYFIGNLLRDGI